jgi:hypothetical protein
MNRPQYAQLACALSLRDWQSLIRLIQFGGRAVDCASEVFEQSSTSASIHAKLIRKLEEILGIDLGKR